VTSRPNPWRTCPALESPTKLADTDPMVRAASKTPRPITHHPVVAAPTPVRGLALLADLQELTMIAAYRARSMEEEAVFSPFARCLPARRSLLLACGLGGALRYVETIRLSPDDAAHLDGLGWRLGR